MGFELHKRVRLGPIYLDTHNGRVRSWGFKLGRFSRNMTSGRTTIDTPGPGRFSFGGKRRRR
ncbi:DUF4236 domain-containing protein [Saccharopolyspora griseoalba]|uniref:DUF4236 domain-containing protein n=1 Tax=Saccharopolyspora griseoalba TaxID=1431848 RepID=A0ABW2LE94_9PSEU